MRFRGRSCSVEWLVRVVWPARRDQGWRTDPHVRPRPHVRTMGKHVLKCRDGARAAKAKSARSRTMLNAIVRPQLALLACLALGACATAPMPMGWTRADSRAVDPKQLEADKAICRDELDQAARVAAARGVAPITLPGQDSPAVKLSIDCMARRGYSPIR
jgi:hypothetical protein